MPNDLVVKGSAAVKKVQKQVKDLETLTGLIEAEKPGGKVTSCNLSARIVGAIVSNKALTVPPKWGAKKADERVATIAELLNTPKMVYINIVPDHHYIVVPIDTDKVSILQGFEGVYNLVEWMENRGLGVMRKDEFVAAMSDLISGNGGKRKEAAVKLFSYDLATKKGPDAARVKKEIVDYYAPSATLSSCAYKDL